MSSIGLWLWRKFSVKYFFRGFLSRIVEVSSRYICCSNYSSKYCLDWLKEDDIFREYYRVGGVLLGFKILSNMCCNWDF